MSVLTSKGRDRMAQSKFALPGGRYPVNDPAHARDALSRASQQLAKGNLTPVQAAKVRHKADVVLGQTDSTYHGA